MGMRILAGEAGITTPQLYSDTAYQRSTHFRLSTSQVNFFNDIHTHLQLSNQNIIFDSSNTKAYTKF